LKRQIGHSIYEVKADHAKPIEQVVAPEKPNVVPTAG